MLGHVRVFERLGGDWPMIWDSASHENGRSNQPTAPTHGRGQRARLVELPSLWDVPASGLLGGGLRDGAARHRGGQAAGQSYGRNRVGRTPVTRDQRSALTFLAALLAILLVGAGLVVGGAMLLATLLGQPPA
jgi:hypothetical protein